MWCAAAVAAQLNASIASTTAMKWRSRALTRCRRLPDALARLPVLARGDAVAAAKGPGEVARLAVAHPVGNQLHLDRAALEEVACRLQPQSELRLETARHLLEGSTVQVQLIADRVGYRKPGDFTRAFRRRYGVTPREYRQARQGVRGDADTE